MTMNSKYVYAFAGLLLGLTACSNEDLLNQAGQHNGETVFVSLSVDRSLQGTRTILSEADADGGVGLSSVWAKGDKVTLVSASGQVAGTLTLEGEGGESEGVFSGELSIADGKYSVWYLGAEPAYAKFEENSLVNALATSGCAVSGDFSDLNKGELMKSEVEIIVRDGKASVAENVTLAPQMAMAHFTLAMDGLETALAADGSKLTLSYSVGETPYSYTITNKKADVYVPLFPGEYAPSFTLASEGKTYTYAFAHETIVEAGLYYTGDKNSTTGESEGIKVTLKDPDENDPYEGYENEDPRNPLHKFAKYNLVRVGERGSLENGFASSETENGALYQWGRNYGYMDRSGTYYSNGITISGDFTNYFDAFGDYTWIDNYGYLSTSESSNYSRLHDYYVYTRENYYWTSGTGARGNTIGGAWISIDNFYGYDNVEVLKSNPDKFFINYSEGTEDYWLNGFTGDGSTWTARAKACGYETENPCPMGWRMPTEADFMEICPSSMPSYAGDLSTLITQKVTPELRETNTGVKYVIRWLNYTDYMSIQAIVVADSFKENDIAAIIWDNNPEVVERKFPFTGNIVSYAAKDTRLSASRWSNGLGQTVMLVIPYTLGTMKQESKTSVYNYTLFTPNQNYGSAVGGYWVGDSKKTFQFFDRSKGDGKGSSSIDIRTTGAQAAYAIRPVMDK